MAWKQKDILLAAEHRERGIHYIAAMTGVPVGTARKDMHLLMEMKRGPEGGWAVGDADEPRSKRMALVKPMHEFNMRMMERIKWTPEEEDTIVAAFARGDRIEAIAKCHRRSVDAVLDRLVALGMDPGRVYLEWQREKEKEGA